MAEFYLALVAAAAAFYFLWGVYDPASQQEAEHRWMHSMAGSNNPLSYSRPRGSRLRNTIGMVVSLVVLVLAIFGYESRDTVDHSNEREAPTTQEQREAAEVDDTLRRQSERADAYYRTNSPLGRGER